MGSPYLLISHRVTACLENLEMSRNLRHVREKILSGINVPKLFIIS